MTQLEEVSSGIDTLNLSGTGELRPDIGEELQAHKDAAQESRAAIAFAMGDGGWSVLAHGMGRYRFCLVHEFGQVGVTDSRSLPALRIQPRSRFLHALGPGKAVEWLESQVEDLVPDVRLAASRLDVYADWLGFDLAGDRREEFVCRAGRLTTHEQGAGWTGFEFGRRATGTVAARIYDKTRQATEGGHDWWCDVWQRPLDAANPVTRVEFEVGRQGLREFGLDGAQEAIKTAPQIWRALTGSWLSHRTPNSDSIAPAGPCPRNGSVCKRRASPHTPLAWIVCAQGAIEDHCVA